VNIGKKLIIGFLAVALVGAIIGTVGILNIWMIKSGQDKQYQDDTVPLTELIGVEASFQKIRIYVRDMLFAADDSELQAAIASLAAQLKAFAATATRKRSPTTS